MAHIAKQAERCARDLHNNLYHAQREVSRILTQNGILHWGEFGTLIGALRCAPNGGIIKWDDDIDFAVDASQEKLLASMKETEFKKAGIDLRLSDYLGYKAVYKNAFVDLFLVDMGLLGKDECMLTKPQVKKRFSKHLHYTRDELLPLQEVPFGSGKLLVPRSPEKRLSDGYGADWRTTAVTYGHGQTCTMYGWAPNAKMPCDCATTCKAAPDDASRDKFFIAFLVVGGILLAALLIGGLALYFRRRRSSQCQVLHHPSS